MQFTGPAVFQAHMHCRQPSVDYVRIPLADSGTPLPRQILSLRKVKVSPVNDEVDIPGETADEIEALVTGGPPLKSH